MNGMNGNGGAITKGWALGLVMPVLLGILIWVGKGLANGLKTEAATNVSQERRLDRHESRLESQDGTLREINRKLDILLETVPRR